MAIDGISLRARKMYVGICTLGYLQSPNGFNGFSPNSMHQAGSVNA